MKSITDEKRKKKVKENKEWKPIAWEQCENCGNDLEVLTACSIEGNVYDSDEVRCVECKATGSVSIEEDGLAWICMNYNIKTTK